MYVYHVFGVCNCIALFVGFSDGICERFYVVLEQPVDLVDDQSYSDAVLELDVDSDADHQCVCVANGVSFDVE